LIHLNPSNLLFLAWIINTYYCCILNNIKFDLLIYLLVVAVDSFSGREKFVLWVRANNFYCPMEIWLAKVQSLYNKVL
jgi:hypothetical protein